ncbi:MAG: hypothetical protein ABIF04_07930 [Chloroflexota bacterium]
MLGSPRLVRVVFAYRYATMAALAFQAVDSIVSVVARLLVVIDITLF